MVAAASARVHAIELKFLCAEPRVIRVVVEAFGDFFELFPRFGGLNVDFDHTRVRRDAERLDAMIVRRLVAFDDDRAIKFCSGILDGGDDLEILLQLIRWRHENVQRAVAGFDAECKRESIRC